MEKKEITGEQKLYVLLDNIYRKTEYEQEIWSCVHDNISPDDDWYNNVASLLVASKYLNRGCVLSGEDARVVYDVTEKGRRQIPILWNGSRLKKEHEEELKTLKKESSFGARHKMISKILWKITDALIGAVVGSAVTYIMLKQR